MIFAVMVILIHGGWDADKARADTELTFDQLLRSNADPAKATQWFNREVAKIAKDEKRMRTINKLDAGEQREMLRRELVQRRKTDEDMEKTRPWFLSGLTKIDEQAEKTSPWIFSKLTRIDKQEPRGRTTRDE